MSDPTRWTLCCRDAGCLSGVRTNLLGTVLQGCRLFKGLGSYLPALACRDAGWLSGVGTFLLGTVGLGSRLFKWCWKLPPGHCGAGCLSSVGTYSPALWGRGADCLRGVGTYLLSTAGQRCRMLKRCQFLLHQQDRGAELDTVLF